MGSRRITFEGVRATTVSVGKQLLEVLFLLRIRRRPQILAKRCCKSISFYRSANTLIDSARKLAGDKINNKPLFGFEYSVLPVLRMLGSFDRPIDEKALGTLLKPPAILVLQSH